MKEPTIVLGDNVQAGRWATEDMITVGNRFIERMYFKVREGVANGDIEPRYINTKLNVADVMTKAASREVVALMQKILSGEEPWPEIPDSETALRIQVADLACEGEGGSEIIRDLTDAELEMELGQLDSDSDAED